MKLKAPIYFTGGDGGDGGEVVVPDPLSIVLQATSPFEVDHGRTMDAINLAPFASVSGGNGQTVGDLTWSAAVPGDLPPGVTLSGSSLVGTPTTVDEYDFEIVAKNGDAEGRQVYTIIVNGVAVQLTSISAGSYHTCGLTPDKGVLCWGWGDSGRLGNGQDQNSTSPVRVLGVNGVGLLTNVSQVVAGGDGACAITATSTVVCWGRGTQGQVGQGALENSNVPKQVVGVGGTGTLSGVTKLAANGNHVCALLDSKKIACWGDNRYAQLGDATAINRAHPVLVRDSSNSADLVNANDIAIGTDSSCAVVGGRAFCWGRNNRGQLGTGDRIDSLLPKTVVSTSGSGRLMNVTGLSGGSQHMCATTSDIGLVCWGYNNLQQLGSAPGAQQYKEYPHSVAGLGGAGVLGQVTQVVAGSQHVCAIKSGQVICWGYNAFGNLGDGAQASRYAAQWVKDASGDGLLTGVTALASGGNHSCAVASGGTQCWGYNNFGQIGASGMNWSLLPVVVNRGN